MQFGEILAIIIILVIIYGFALGQHWFNRAHRWESPQSKSFERILLPQLSLIDKNYQLWYYHNVYPCSGNERKRKRPLVILLSPGNHISKLIDNWASGITLADFPTIAINTRQGAKTSINLGIIQELSPLIRNQIGLIHPATIFIQYNRKLGTVLIQTTPEESTALIWSRSCSKHHNKQIQILNELLNIPESNRVELIHGGYSFYAEEVVVMANIIKFILKFYPEILHKDNLNENEGK